jgi:hypothetical protein
MNIGAAVMSVIAAVVGLAIVAVIVSKNAQAPAVITGAGQALSQIIGAAVSPVANTQGNAFGGASTSATGAIV